MASEVAVPLLKRGSLPSDPEPGSGTGYRSPVVSNTSMSGHTTTTSWSVRRQSQDPGIPPGPFLSHVTLQSTLPSTPHVPDRCPRRTGVLPRMSVSCVHRLSRVLDGSSEPQPVTGPGYRTSSLTLVVFKSVDLGHQPLRILLYLRPRLYPR